MNPTIYVLSINGLLLFFSIVFYFFPPKKINHIYGYRTKRSMLNDTIWQFANQQFIIALLKYSSLGLVAAVVFASLGSGQINWQPMVILLFSLGAAILKTEQSLNTHFDEEGNKKNLKK